MDLSMSQSDPPKAQRTNITINCFISGSVNCAASVKNQTIGNQSLKTVNVTLNRKLRIEYVMF